MKKSLPDKLMFPLLGFALLSLLLTPFLVQYDLEKSMQKVASVVALDPGLQEDETSSFTITSRVIKLSENNPKSLAQDYAVETKQFRFEVQLKKYLRRPSAKTVESVALEKKSKDGNWENVELLASGEEGVYSSVFIEADEGSNEFRLVLQNDSKKIFPLNVKYRRKNI